MLKRIIKLVIVFCILITGLSVFAQTSEAACQRTHLGTQCKNNVLMKKNLKVYYTKSQVNKVVNRYNQLGSNKGQLINFILGLNVYPTGLAVLMTNIGANNIIGPFKKAKSKKTGLEISYTYTVYKDRPNAASQISGVKYKYR
ncbi:hypothetical protein MOF28_05285 [Bacillus haynesii]|uniref:hypothetical protein n=1 Tax=Bacillus haynesii TaxID=1925021 RepID=UPI0022832621|nr:hypothetical protein [Bacillus haynesii]MCY9337764.1 hypothetical protein [Bacillus haynesii]